MASVSGRVVALPSPPVRSGNRWLVPLDFLPRALGPISTARIDLRRPSRLLIVGDLRVPRVTARIDVAGPADARHPRDRPGGAGRGDARKPGRLVVRIEADALDLDVPGRRRRAHRRLPARRSAVHRRRRARRTRGPARAVPADADGITRITIEVPGSRRRAKQRPSACCGATAAGAAAPPAGLLDVARGCSDHRDRSRARRRRRGRARSARCGGKADHARGGAPAANAHRNAARHPRDPHPRRRPDVSLDERAAVANNSKADLFLSLHLNAAPVGAVAGAEVFYLRLDREGEDARRAAESDERAAAGPWRSDALDRRHPVGPGAGAPRRGVCRAGRDPRGESRGAQVQMSAQPRQERRFVC